MTSVRVYVNTRGYDLPAGATALDAVRVADPVEADAVTAGSRQIADSRGIVIASDTPVYGGVIYRTVGNRSRDDETAT